MKRITLLFLMLSIAGLAAAEEYRVALDEVAGVLKKATPGDRIVVKRGTYRDMELKWIGHGTEQAPIRIEAEEPDSERLYTYCGRNFVPRGTVVSGRSSLRLAGEWIEVSGFDFLDGCAPKGAVVEFRCGKEVANHCRLTDCVIDNYNPVRRDIANSYIALYGRHNRVDHCNLTGKLNLGVTLVVILNEERNLQNYHRIDHNLFGYRPVYGSNGAETIRVGTSHQAYSSSNTIIEDNLFDRCNGEVEVVSIKSSDNIIRNNRFWECEGVLALRHGDRNEVYGNIFVGNGKRNTGGVRVVNAGHRIHDNRFYSLAGARFFSALALMNAVPNSLPNRYCLVEDIDIRDNLFVDCTNIEFGTGKDQERTLAPERVLFENNTIVNRSLRRLYIAIDQLDGITFRGNRAELLESYKADGFKFVKAKVDAAPSYEEMAEGTGAGRQPVSDDFTECYFGPIEVAAGEDLPAVVERAKEHDVICLTTSGGDYVIDRALVLDKELVIEAADGLAERPVIRFAGDKTDNMITLADGCGDATIRGIAFSGRPEPGKPLAKAGISTAADMICPYSLTVEDCEFADFGESGFFAVKGTKGTFGESVTIRNCLFRNLSGDAINYADEREDKGRYSADDMLIENCSFFRLLGLPINIYRGGSDESTAGPYVTIRGCNFEDCCNKERGSVIRAIGPQVMTIEECNFSNSGRGGVSIRLDETSWEKIDIRNCNFWNSGRILTMTERVVRGGITHDEPRYVDAEHFDFRRK